MSLKSRTLSVLLPLFCAFGLLLFPGVPALAQSASVSGRVIDPSSAVVRKAQITFTDLAKGTSQTTQTNDAGFYSLPFVQPGTYALAVEANGFKRFERTKITVETAQSLVLDVRLQVGDVSQSVTVDGSGNGINTTDASVSTVIDRQFVQDIPLNGRSFQSLMTAIPGVQVVPSSGVGATGEIAVNGQRTESNYFTVDGVSVNSGATSSSGYVGVGGGFSGNVPGESALGTTQSMVSIDDLQEFRATTSTYSAEYGRTPGGQFTFTTRSGTNDWHGTAFDYFRNSALDANNYFNKRTTPITTRQAERQNDFGGTLGGPIQIPKIYKGLNHTFFFFSYEGLRLTNPQAATSESVPNLWLRQHAAPALQPFVNAFPLPDSTDATEGNGFDTVALGFSEPASLDASSIRIDHTFKDRLHIFGRYADTSSDIIARTSSNLANLQSSAINVKMLTLGATYSFTPRMANDLRFNLSKNNNSSSNSLDNLGGATPISSTALAGYTSPHDSFWFCLCWMDYPAITIANTAVSQNQINIVDSVGYSTGRHNIKFGIDYRRLSSSSTVEPLYEEGYFSSSDEVANNAPDFSIFGKGTAAWKPIYTNFSVFVQDDWKATPKLNLSLGVRWDVNPAPTDSNGATPFTLNQTTNLATAQLAPQGTPLWKTDWTGFAPRIGLAYQVHQVPGHETVVRAGGGIFYDTGNVNGSEGYNDIGFSGSIQAGPLFGTSPVSFPATQADIDAIPAPSVATPYSQSVFAFDPHLRLPYTAEWNMAVEQGFGENQTLTLSYVGSAGRRLLMEKQYVPYSLGNTNFAAGIGLDVTNNAASSDYHSLQVQFQRKLSHGLQALFAYTWAHATDDVTQNLLVYEQEHADSDYDIRNNFQAAVTYSVPSVGTNQFVSTLINHWSMDARISARSSLPVDVIGSEGVDPYTTAALDYHPNRVPGVPLYIRDPDAPGGRAINFNAFSIATDTDGNPVEGDFTRNGARAFDAVQADIALRREFRFTERVGLQFRAEAFNILNHPVMGTVENLLSSGNVGSEQFGYAQNTQNNQLGGLNSLYQVGGPRSLQLALRLHF